MGKIELERNLSVFRVTRLVSSEYIPYTLLSNCILDDYIRKLSENALFLLYNDEDDLGFVAFYENRAKQVIYITLIAVKREFKRKGIGSKLLYQLEREYKGTEYKGIELEVSKANKIAYQFYLSHGFNNLEDRNNKILMRKEM